jgi:predicted esterase
LKQCGAEVQVHWDPGGHTIGVGQVKAAQEWLKRRIGD